MTSGQRTLLGGGLAACVLVLTVVPLRGGVGAGSAAGPPEDLAPGRLRGGASAGQAGDVARGKTLFESNGCFDCHRIADRGSRLGPDLSDIGDRRTPDRLQQALVAPDEEVLPENRFVRLVTKEGTSVTGRLLNQDAISVQLINQKEELKSYLRTGLREYAIVEKGLMPSVQGKLTPQQVADVVNYLGSLKAN